MTHRPLDQRLRRVLLALQFASQGSAVDYSREVVSSTPTKKKEPAAADLTALQWAEQMARHIEAGERLIDGEPWQPSLSLGALKQAVRPHSGRSSGFVAYALRQPVERVVAARTALGVDPETGLQRPKPLTSRELPA